MAGFDDAALLAEMPMLRRMADAWRARDPEDLVQETCRRALTNRHRFDAGGGDFPAWLVTIMKRLRIDIERPERSDRGRKPRYFVGLDKLTEKHGLSLRAPPNQEHVVSLNELGRAIARMNDAAAAMLIPAAIGYGQNEIAAALGCAKSTVSKRLDKMQRALLATFGAALFVLCSVPGAGA